MGPLIEPVPGGTGMVKIVPARGGARSERLAPSAAAERLRLTHVRTGEVRASPGAMAGVPANAPGESRWFNLVTEINRGAVPRDV